jgi:hypothetical protein
MSRVGQGVLAIVGLFAVWSLQPVAAQGVTEQNNYEAGKTPAQMFATDCGICHKSAAGLSKAPGLFGLESFLREHYTASKEAAAMIAAYVKSVDAAQPPARAAIKRRSNASREKPADKPAESKSAKSKSTESKSTESKSAGSKSAEPKAADSKPAEPATTSATAKPAAADSSSKSD